MTSPNIGITYGRDIKRFKVGFTSTQYGTQDWQRRRLSGILYNLFVLDAEFHHGNCIGGDEQGAFVAKHLGYRVVAHPPLNERKMSLVAPNDEAREPKDYIPRNHDIVNEVNILIAVPREPEEVIRSGTWATIRYCKATYPNKICHLIIP